MGEGPGFFPNRQKGPVTPPLPMPGPPAGGAGGQRCLREGEEGPSLPAHHHQPGSDQQRGEGESPPAAGRSDSGPGAARLKSGGGTEDVQVITEELNRQGLAYVWGLMGLPGGLARIIIDSGNLVGDVVSEEFARQANLAGEPCQKDIETAAAAGKMQIIGRCYPIRLRIAGIGTPFEIQPWIVRGMKNAVNLGQLFLSRHNAHLTFMEGKVSLQIGGSEVQYTWRRKCTGGSTDKQTKFWLPPDPRTELRQKRGRVPGRLCFPLGSGRGCWRTLSVTNDQEMERGNHPGGRSGAAPPAGRATGEEEPWTEIHPRWREPPQGGGRAAGGDKGAGATGGSGPRA